MTANYFRPPKDFSPDFRTLYVQQKAKRGVIQPYLKTKNGRREVDLCETLAAVLREYVGERKSGLLFHTASGKQLSQRNVLRDSLYQALEKIDSERGGFNIFRRYRITLLDTSECPASLKNFWSGHSQQHVSERYTKLFWRTRVQLTMG